MKSNGTNSSINMKFMHNIFLLKCAISYKCIVLSIYFKLISWSITIHTYLYSECVQLIVTAWTIIIIAGEEKRYGGAIRYRQKAGKNLSRDPRHRRHKVLSKMGMTLVAYWTYTYRTCKRACTCIYLAAVF